MEHFTAVFSFCGLVGAVVAPVLGLLADCIVGRARRRTTDAFTFRVEEVCSHFLPILITTVASIILYSALLFFQEWAVFVSLLGLVVARSCIFSTSTAFLRVRFPVEHLDRLMGIYNTLVSILLLLVYPYFIWEMQDYYSAVIVGLVFIVIALSYPLHILYKRGIKRALLELPQPAAILRVSSVLTSNIDPPAVC